MTVTFLGITEVRNARGYGSNQMGSAMTERQMIGEMLALQ